MKRSAAAAFVVPPDCPPGRPLLDVLRDAGFLLAALCGGRGVCGGCAVRIDPAPPAGSADRRFFEPSRLAAGYRLACVAPAVPGARVSEFELIAEAPAAGARKGRLVRETGPAGLAVDAGTTTVACALVVRTSGRVAAEGHAPNRQAAFGGDVISRIEYASRGKTEQARLRQALAGSIREAASAACAAAGIPEKAIRGGAVAGNPAMIHLLLGADASRLGKAPFRLAVRGGKTVPAGEAGFPGEQAAPVAILPLGGVTLGGDVIGGAAALRMDGAGPPRLLLDVGTNTEMILRVPARRGRKGAGSAPRRAGAFAASAASGGAFEGESISCGMRAGPGAVTGAYLDAGEIRLAVTGGGAPLGLSGSGLLDLAALLRRTGVVEPSGRMRAREELFGTAPPGIVGRVVRGKGGEAGFLLARPAGRAVVLGAADIRQLQLAKAAIRAGIDILLSEAGVGPEEVGELYLAGAFGNGIDEESARDTGLLPPFPSARIVRAGNGALMGAVEATRDPAFLGRAVRFARRLRVVALADHRDFPGRFLGAMEFPPAG